MGGGAVCRKKNLVSSLQKAFITTVRDKMENVATYLRGKVIINGSDTLSFFLFFFDAMQEKPKYFYLTNLLYKKNHHYAFF